MHRKKTVYVAISTIFVFRPPLGVLEHIPSRLGETAIPEKKQV